MSSIEEILKQILAARFGKDVRQAIHDGIEQCYEDGKVGAVDLVARQRIANLVANEGNTEKDSEVIDARVSASGIVYDSLGDAVRANLQSYGKLFYSNDSVPSGLNDFNNLKANTVYGYTGVTNLVNPPTNAFQGTVITYSYATESNTMVQLAITGDMMLEYK